jgi:hypothetical protein
MSNSASNRSKSSDRETLKKKKRLHGYANKKVRNNM